ncbi:tryptophan dimethylallyltransferase-domain-containing protein [Aspergillus cavernicola]|uniref:Tryptophan dimethylallyltransferase-domain-containing protein n=1 Tax=Aspergillus cavernicola TaxID=176166 RepID=A0ABR4I2J1_9EURO
MCVRRSTLEAHSVLFPRGLGWIRESSSRLSTQLTKKTGTNGITSHRRSLSDGALSTEAWKVLSQALPSRRHLAVLLDAAAYPIERQYEAFYTTITMLYAPYLGPASRASGDTAQWKSMLQLDGTPFEFSWKWNAPDGEPDGRISLEPIVPMAGTALDPLNHSTTPTLFDHDYAKYTEEAARDALIGTSLTYFQPHMLNQHGLLDIPRWEASFQKLHPDAPSRMALREFMATSPEGKLLKPFCLSVDNCDLSKARPKWYFNSPRINFTAIREIMTLGGRIPATEMRERQFKDLLDLLRTLAEQPADFPENSEFPFTSSNNDSALDSFAEMADMLKRCVYFFDIAPGKSLPEIKLYFPVRNHCRNDLAATQNLIQWLNSGGRGQYGPSFLRALEAVADYRRLDEGGGLQSFVSCQFKSDGDLDLTSYFNPEAFRSARLTNRRSTRRRGDW